jgi:DNA repair ATPase RecN
MAKQRKGLFRLTRQPWRTSILTLGLLTLLGIGLILYAQQRPDYYQPARPSLTEAKRHLDVFYADEKLLLKTLSETRWQLEQTLKLLTKAQQQLSLEQRQTLDRLRYRLYHLEDIHNTERMTPDSLRETYRQLAAELSDLIDGLGDSHQR